MRISTVLVCAVGLLFVNFAGAAEERFKTQPGFKVEQVIGKEIGSVVAMTFDENGDIVVAEQGGPIRLVKLPTKSGAAVTASVLTDKVKNSQGLLCLDGALYIVGDGPSGTAFYRLRDDKLETLFKFRGGMGEHGPHQPILGPDGLIYLIIGNHAGVQDAVEPTSPHHHYYDGELFNPKYEDANGHAAGIKAPCGTVIRCDRDGKHVELVCGGFRNAYDIAFSPNGELFTWDSDMEWDEGLPWYRPTRVNHIIPGADFGWRSGWSKWPDYRVDSLGSILDTGRGSPTGVTFYNGFAYPEKYRGALFLCDWSRGRLLAVRLKPNGASYKGEEQVFLEGKPLNVPDMEMGRDGNLYFCTGGRGTEGGVYRIVNGSSPLLKLNDSDISFPNLNSLRGLSTWGILGNWQLAWARNDIAAVKRQLGDRWNQDLTAEFQKTESAGRKAELLRVMQLFGPAPTPEMLITASQGQGPVREYSAYLLGLHPTDAVHKRLNELLSDPEPRVRRIACESLVRIGKPAPKDKLLKLLAEPDRYVSWAARRALEQLPQADWENDVLQSKDIRVFIQGSVALLGLAAEKAPAAAILARVETELAGQPTPDNLLDLLRVAELALYRGQASGDSLTGLRTKLMQRYPTSDWRINRELVRTLVFLQEPTLAKKLVEQLATDMPVPEKIHIVMHAKFLTAGWTPELKLAWLSQTMKLRQGNGGHSYKGYLTNSATDLIRTLTPEEIAASLEKIGDDYTLAAVYVRALPEAIPESIAGALVELDKTILEKKTDNAKELQKEIVLALGRSGDNLGMAHVRQLFESYPDRRNDCAAAITTFAQKKQKTPADFLLLCRALNVAEGNTVRDVMRILTKFSTRGTKPELRRRVIIVGLDPKNQAAADSVGLMEYWTGEKLGEAKLTPQEKLALWQTWYAKEYPDQPEARLPETEKNKYQYKQLLGHLTNPAHKGDATRGAAVFEKATCIKCHKYGNRGESVGPDLTAVSKRFQKKEIIESVLFPSLVISDQYQSKIVVTTEGKQYLGIVGNGPGGDYIVLQPNAEKIVLKPSDIEEMKPSKMSAMPEQLLNPLTLEEITDLFAYLYSNP